MYLLPASDYTVDIEIASEEPVKSDQSTANLQSNQITISQPSQVKDQLIDAGLVRSTIIFGENGYVIPNWHLAKGPLTIYTIVRLAK